MSHTDRSNEIRKRYIEGSNSGDLIMSDELIVLDHLVKKFNLTTKSQFAREKGVSLPYISKRCKDKKEAIIKLNGVELILN
jgi:hypothetical protein